MPWPSALSTLISILKSELKYVSWVGFYELRGEDLWIGPYQGKLACVHIPQGKGVCGASVSENKAMIVADVHSFEGHIACDPLSRSEIVVPVYRKGILWGVLDLDSYEPSAFDAIDQIFIQKFLKEIETF